MRKTNNYRLTLYDKEDKMYITSENNSLNANMVIIDNALKEKSDIKDLPTKTSQLENDSEYVNKSYVDGIVGDIETFLRGI